jgi:hypothetical protein
MHTHTTLIVAGVASPRVRGGQHKQKRGETFVRVAFMRGKGVKFVRSHCGPNLLKCSALSNICWILSEMLDLEPRWVDVSQLLTVGPCARLVRYEPQLLLDGIQFERPIDNLLFRIS